MYEMGNGCLSFQELFNMSDTRRHFYFSTLLRVRGYNFFRDKMLLFLLHCLNKLEAECVPICNHIDGPCFGSQEIEDRAELLRELRLRGIL